MTAASDLPVICGISWRGKSRRKPSTSASKNRKKMKRMAFSVWAWSKRWTAGRVSRASRPRPARRVPQEPELLLAEFRKAEQPLGDAHGLEGKVDGAEPKRVGQLDRVLLVEQRVQNVDPKFRLISFFCERNWKDMRFLWRRRSRRVHVPGGGSSSGWLFLLSFDFSDGPGPSASN